jgi:squalene-hopene/tetraprenyl-beta-curcumene cyclase
MSLRLSIAGFLLGLLASSALAAPDSAKIAEARKKGVDFIKTTQAADGSWTSPTQPGISGLVVYGLLSGGAPVDDPVVAKGLKHLESFIQEDGGIYDKNTAHKNYETSIIILALKAANADHRYDDQIKKAVVFLKGIQWDADEGAQPDDAAYGGQGYGRSKRPDLSNTSFFLDALQSAGVPSDDPAFKNALVFVSRCQNLESEYNNTPFASKINDGGFYYTSAGGGASMAGNTPDGGLRSYGSMTYAGLKSMIYAGVSKDDPRVKAASEWIAKHYTLDENPGMAQAGLYYYFHMYAKTMAALEEEGFKDESGKIHEWRTELSDKLLGLQKPNGSWINATERWYEGNPDMATAYSLICLKYCDPPKAK